MRVQNLIRRLDLTSLHLFVAICEEGTLTRAADREGIAASALSKRLTELEEALGTELFLRHPKGMIPTAAGETLLHHARSVLLLTVLKVGTEIQEYAQGIRGHIRMLANISAIVQFLPDDLPEFFALHEAVKVDLKESLSAEVVRGVEEGLGDVGVCVASTESRDLETRAYHADRLVLAVPHQHPLCDRGSIRFVDSLDYDHIGLHSDSAIYTRAVVAAGEAGRVVKLRIHVPGFDALYRMVQSGLGVGLIPNRAFEALGFANALTALPLTDDWASRELKIVLRSWDSLSPAARLLVEHLEHRVQLRKPA